MDEEPETSDAAERGEAALARDNGDSDRTAVVRELYGRVPFHRAHDVEVLLVTTERAETKVPYDDPLVGNPDLQALHGGVISSLVDLTGAAVFVGDCEDYTPTIDLRVNYLSAAGRRPLYASATVERTGGTIGVATVEVESGDEICATGTGVYKLGDD
jgi:uncharacterized domain 1